MLLHAFLLHQLWTCSSEDETGTCCMHTVMPEETDRADDEAYQQSSSLFN